MNFRYLITAVIQLGITVSALGMVIMVYCYFAEQYAHKRANDFCASVHINSSAEQVIARAVAAGAVQRYLKWRLGRNEYEHKLLPVVFTGATPLSRHMCNIEARNKTVVGAHYSYLD
ncbi:hypothetical protein [Chitinimonas sp.]|uniref:hypothetical protein n=1 Tax=Chitinimonas sp. TaxID=1934313 RepID=UPI0035ADFB63